MKIKRIVDLVCSIVAVVVLSPLLVVIALWIKIGSNGPVFFCQTRVGRYGRLFKVIKFRTMIPDAEAHGMQLTTGEDVRITKAGRLLRKYKLDELPQLFNVIAGQMSLVGPRPEVPRYMAWYPPEMREAVLSVRPGITDYASMEFCNENELLDEAEDPEQEYINKILPLKISYYYKYANSNSILEDVCIIFSTLKKLYSGSVGRRGGV